MVRRRSIVRGWVLPRYFNFQCMISSAKQTSLQNNKQVLLTRIEEEGFLFVFYPFQYFITVALLSRVFSLLFLESFERVSFQATIEVSVEIYQICFVFSINLALRNLKALPFMLQSEVFLQSYELPFNWIIIFLSVKFFFYWE